MEQCPASSVPDARDPVILWGQFNAWMLDERGWSKATRKARLSTVQTAHHFIREKHGRTLLRASPDHVLSFLAEADAARTRNTYLNSLRAFFRFAKQKQHRRGDPTKDIHRIKEPRSLPRPLTPNQARRLLLAATKLDARTYVIVSLLLYTGLRRLEASSLNWADVSVETREIRVMGKGAKERIVPISSRLLGVLVEWHRLSTNQWVFPSPRPDAPLGELGVWRDVKEAAKLAKIPNVTPHRLRHSFATEYLKQGGNIRRLQQILGHASLASTQIYTLVTTEELRTDVERLNFGG